MSSCGTCRKEGREPRCSHEISLMIRESVNVLIPEVKATRNLEYYYNSHSAGGGYNPLISGKEAEKLQFIECMLCVLT